MYKIDVESSFNLISLSRYEGIKFCYFLTLGLSFFHEKIVEFFKNYLVLILINLSYNELLLYGMFGLFFIKIQ
jgi:hypothetical protein